MLSYQQLASPPDAQLSQMQNAQQQTASTTSPNQNHDSNLQTPANQQQPTMRLREEPAPINPTTTRTSRKRKSPPDTNAAPPAAPQQQQQQQQQQQPQPQVIHVLPPPHVMMHPPPHLQGIHPFAQYATTDYTPGGLPPQPIQAQPADQQTSQSPPPSANGNRALSNSKRAEQNRKAQRAFRERRDQHVKALESRSQLLDAALASADEANRRWEECRALVDQLRVENAALRAALSQAHILPPGVNPSAQLPTPAPPPATQPAPPPPSTASQEEGSKENAVAPPPESNKDRTDPQNTDLKKDG